MGLAAHDKTGASNVIIDACVPKNPESVMATPTFGPAVVVEHASNVAVTHEVDKHALPPTLTVEE